MRKVFFLLVLGLLIALPSFAIFCTGCGERMPDQAKFCSKCGGKITPSSSSKPAPIVVKTVTEEPAKTPSTNSPAANATFRAKTDLYVYAKRGDEHNVLKKNLFFKPRRDRIKANCEIRILEVVGDSYLVELVPSGSEQALRGWITEQELALRTTWKK